MDSFQFYKIGELYQTITLTSGVQLKPKVIFIIISQLFLIIFIKKFNLIKNLLKKKYEYLRKKVHITFLGQNMSTWDMIKVLTETKKSQFGVSHVRK